MNIKVSKNIPIKNQLLFKEAVEYFAKKLMSSRMANSLNVEVKVKNDMSVKGSAGGCLAQVNGSKVSKDFIIEIDGKEPIQEQVEYLAHECVHMQQGSAGTLQYRQWKSDNKVHVRWSGQELGINNEIAYEDRPWEKEAYALQQPLTASFLCFKFGTEEKQATYDESLTQTMRSLFHERNINMEYSQILILQQSADNKKARAGPLKLLMWNFTTKQNIAYQTYRIPNF